MQLSAQWKPLLWGLIFLGAGYMAFSGVRGLAFVRTSHYVCELVEENFFRKDWRLQKWVEECRRKAKEAFFYSSKRELLSSLQRHLERLKVSHLNVYNPYEEKRLWSGKSQETGLEAIELNGGYWVVRVNPKSPAAQTGLKIGDQILSINGERPRNPWSISYKSGFFRWSRDDSVLSGWIETKEIQVDRAPQLKDLGNGQALVTISSFRGEYFQESNWLPFVKRINSFDALIVDLRDNPGGNFVAMLRALSPFLCNEPRIGTLHQPRQIRKTTTRLENAIDEGQQIELLDQYQKIHLHPYKGYPCYHGPVAVLVNENSASVTEIFAQAIRSRSRTVLIGQPTSGDVILGMWYHLPMLGKGYSLSIPEAVYRDKNGLLLEGEGVWPQIDVRHNVPSLTQGKDAFVEKAKFWIRRQE